MVMCIVLNMSVMGITASSNMFSDYSMYPLAVSSLFFVHTFFFLVLTHFFFSCCLNTQTYTRTDTRTRIRMAQSKLVDRCIHQPIMLVNIYHFLFRMSAFSFLDQKECNELHNLNNCFQIFRFPWTKFVSV